MWYFLRALLSTKSPKGTKRVFRQARPRLEVLEDRQVPAVITDMTQLAQQFGRHAGPTTLYLNFDGSSADGVSSFQSVSGDRNRDIHEILFRTQEIFAPFDVIVRRMSGNGSRDTSSAGNSTIFIGDKTSYGTGTGFTGDEHHGAHHDADADGCVCDHNADGVGPTAGAGNKAGASTPWGSSDFPSAGNKGITHQPNSDAYDVAFVDPLYYNAATGTNQSQSIQQIAQAAAHEAGHTFGLVHVLSNPDLDIMSYDAFPNTRFVNKTFNVTNLNWDSSKGSTYNEPKLQPQWQNPVNALGQPIPTVSNITTQNSYTYLRTALGARAATSEWANVANRDSVDASYVDGGSFVLGVGASATGGVGRQGDWDVLTLNVASSGWVQIDVARDGTSTVDPVLLVYNSTGKTLVAFNDDRAAGDVSSHVLFYASAGQSYKLVVGGYGSNSTGGYKVSVSSYYFGTPSFGPTPSPLPSPTPLLAPDSGSNGAGAASGASGAGLRAQDQVFASTAPSPSGRRLAGHSPAGSDGGLGEAISEVARGRHQGQRWDCLVDQLFTADVFA
ncbi:MAG TPA: hypothetical protein VEL76_32840 [Gemmataceae bacterium]|nr:hypothetical protein [Gemmataceae bacterium]